MCESVAAAVFLLVDIDQIQENHSRVFNILLCPAFVKVWVTKQVEMHFVT